VSGWVLSMHLSVLVANFLVGSGDHQVTSRPGEVVRVLDGHPGLYFQSEGRRRTRGGGYILFRVHRHSFTVIGSPMGNADPIKGCASVCAPIPGQRFKTEKRRWSWYSPLPIPSPAFPALPAAIPCLITLLLTSLNHLPSMLHGVDRRPGCTDVN
jgi:hypothetical protein